MVTSHCQVRKAFSVGLGFIWKFGVILNIPNRLVFLTIWTIGLIKLGKEKKGCTIKTMAYVSRGHCAFSQTLWWRLRDKSDEPFIIHPNIYSTSDMPWWPCKALSRGQWGCLTSSNTLSVNGVSVFHSFLSANLACFILLYPPPHPATTIIIVAAP